MIKFIKVFSVGFTLLLFASKTFGQSISDKEIIDSIVAANEKTSFVQKLFVGDSLKATYFINPKTKSVIKMKVETIDKFRKKWVYTYYLDSIQRPLIVSADKIDGKVFRYATYYFKDDKLVYKKETNAKIDYQEKQTESIKYLLDRKPN